MQGTFLDPEIFPEIFLKGHSPHPRHRLHTACRPRGAPGPFWGPFEGGPPRPAGSLREGARPLHPPRPADERLHEGGAEDRHDDAAQHLLVDVVCAHLGSPRSRSREAARASASAARRASSRPRRRP